MRFIVQRVQQASVEVDGRVVGEIGKGFLVFVGISALDTAEIADKMISTRDFWCRNEGFPSQ